MVRSIKVFSIALALINIGAASAFACHGDSECPTGYVCDQRVGACHDPCGTWFPQPNPACHRHLTTDALPQNGEQTLPEQMPKAE